MESRIGAPQRGHWLAVGALALILAITALWWALALWPVPAAGAPAWLVRTRVVCFGTSPSGLPDGYGWLTLIGQPVLMLAMLYVIWGDAVVAGVGWLGRLRAGRIGLVGATTLLFAALVAAGARVASAVSPERSAVSGGAPTLDPPRLDRPAPTLDLVDQHGERVTLARFRGRPVLVAFAYAHCETVCPLVVRDVLRARELAADVAPVAVIVTLDPWRDTPARLGSIAERWGLGSDGFVASDDAGAVAATLDRWNVARQRDLRTGEVAHATPVYVIAPDGRVAYAVSGSAGAAPLAELLRRAYR
jgi:protein SCO1/2